METNRRRFLGLAGGVLGVGIAGIPAQAAAAGQVPAAADTSIGVRHGRLYLGSYGHGIGLSAIDPATGLPGAAVVAADLAAPSYLAYSPDRRTVYAINEVSQGTISAFATRSDGTLRLLGTQSTLGENPVHVHAHPDGRHALSANYTSGSLAVHPVLPGGALGPATDVAQQFGSGPDPTRQQGPVAHQVLTDPAGRFVHGVDLGADTIFGYRLSGGKFVRVHAAHLRPGSGPRHMAFHPSGRVAYVANELDATLTVLDYDPLCGLLAAGQILPTAPPIDVRNYPSEVVVSRDGRFVYLANRGHDSIAVFAVKGNRVAPLGTVPCGGHWPRHITLSGDGLLLYVANQLSGQVATLRVNSRTGALTSAGPALAAGTPVMVLV